MDLRIERRKLEIIQQVKSCEDEVLLDDIFQKLKANSLDQGDSVAPLTKEIYLQRTAEGLESIRKGKVYSTEQVRKFLEEGGGE